MKKKRITIVDVAKAAGVSRATASLVLRKSDLVSDETRKKVEKAITDLDYVPNIGAAHLRGQSSRTVGVIVPNLLNTFFAEFVEGVERVLDGRDYVVMLASSHEDVNRQTRIIRRLRQHDAEGLILIPAEGTNVRQLADLTEAGLSLVQAMRHVGKGQTDFVGSNPAQAVRDSVRHLTDLGHRRLSFVSVLADTSARTERLHSFNAEMAAQGLVNCGTVEVPLAWDGSPQSVGMLMALEPRPTAAICFNDILAAGLLRGLYNRGLTPGRDLSVIGHDDLSFIDLGAPPRLTTVQVFPLEIGGKAAEVLLRRINEPAAPAASVIVPPRLRVRDTTGLCD